MQSELCIEYRYSSPLWTAAASTTPCPGLAVTGSGTGTGVTNVVMRDSNS